MDIQLGSEVRDRVSGFAGVAIGRTEWLTGCTTIVVQPKVGEDGKLPDTHAIDEPNLDIIQPVEPVPSVGG